MNKKEWQKALLFLLRGSKRWLPSYPFLKEDINRKIKTKKSEIINIRVPATEAIAEKYRLTKYKRGNYIIEIV
jgi:hypothetical protein